MLLTLSIENMHGLLQDLYSEMMKMCRPISDVALPLAALGALFFIAYRLWQSMARGEPIDVFGLLRPFVRRKRTNWRMTPACVISSREEATSATSSSTN